MDAFMPCGTLRYSTKGVIKGWDYAVTLGMRNDNLQISESCENQPTNIHNLGRLDYVQFVKGSPRSKTISPDRLRQPANMRLFQIQAKRMLKDTGKR